MLIMNTSGRDSINEMFGDFLKDLHIDPEFLGPFIEKGVLTGTMVDNIQAKTTQSDKVMQLLQVLPRCGQSAFECFLEVLRTRSVWLAEKLQRKYKQKLENRPQSSAAAHKQTAEQRSISSEKDTKDGDEKSQDQEQYPHQEQRLHSTKTNSDASSFSPNASLGSAGAVAIKYQHNLNHLYINLKNKLRKHEKRELSFATPEPATFKMIEKLHDELFEQLTQYQINIDQCYRALGGNHDKVPLMSHIIKLKTAKAELERQLKASEEQRNKYCEQIMKLDLKVRNLASELQINEEKQNRLSKAKEEQEKEYKHQIQILEERVKVAEKKATDAEDATHIWQMNYIKVQKENEQLRKEMYVFQPNYLNRTSAKENLQGILQISHQTNVDQHENHQEASLSITPRNSKANDFKVHTDGQENRKGKLKQARIHRRQSRNQDLSNLSYLSGSRIQNSNFNNNRLLKDLKAMNKSNDNLSVIKQMKLSLQNVMKEEAVQSKSTSKPFKLQVYIPTADMHKNEDTEVKSNDNSNQGSQAPSPQLQSEGRFKIHIPTVNMQRFEPEMTNNLPFKKAASPHLSPKQFQLPIPTVNMQRRIEKDLYDRVSPARKSFERQPLVKYLTIKDVENRNGTKSRRKNTTPQ